MATLIGGSPSTGSSLLRRILNRHSELFCGSETALFTKKEFYNNWNESKHLIFKKGRPGLKSASWHHYNGIIIEDDYYLDDETVLDAVNDSNNLNLKDFSRAFFAKALIINNKSEWIEKTPGNTFVFGDFLNLFPSGKCIHIVRSPLDTIASLVNRGTSVFNAVSLYLLNSSAGLAHYTNPRVLTIKYENLVDNPRAAVERVCQFLGYSFEEEMLIPTGDETGPDHMKGWAYKETENIGNKSIGRFEKLEADLQEEIVKMAATLKSRLVENIHSVKEIANAMEYHFPQSSATSPSTAYKSILKDKVVRDLKKSYFRSYNYPIHV